MAVAKEALKRRNKRGVTNFFKLFGIIDAVMDGTVYFFKNKKIRFSRKSLESVLAYDNLREELIETIAETVRWRPKKGMALGIIS